MKKNLFPAERPKKTKEEEEYSKQLNQADAHRSLINALYFFLEIANNFYVLKKLNYKKMLFFALLLEITVFLVFKIVFFSPIGFIISSLVIFESILILNLPTDSVSNAGNHKQQIKWEYMIRKSIAPWLFVEFSVYIISAIILKDLSVFYMTSFVIIFLILLPNQWVKSRLAFQNSLFIHLFFQLVIGGYSIYIASSKGILLLNGMLVFSFFLSIVCFLIYKSYLYVRYNIPIME